MKKIYIAIVFSALITMFFITSSFYSQTTKPVLDKKIITPTPVVVEKIPIKIVSIFPNKQESGAISITAPIVFTFNQKVDISSLEYTINPELKTKIKTDTTGKELSILPEEYWKPNNEYYLLIKKIKSFDGWSAIYNYEINFSSLVNGESIKIGNAEAQNNP